MQGRNQFVKKLCSSQKARRKNSTGNADKKSTKQAKMMKRRKNAGTYRDKN